MSESNFKFCSCERLKQKDCWEILREQLERSFWIPDPKALILILHRKRKKDSTDMEQIRCAKAGDSIVISKEWRMGIEGAGSNRLHIDTGLLEGTGHQLG